MGIIAWAVWGLFAGAVARLLRPGRQSIGLLGTMILGIVGSLAGGFIASDVLNIADHDDFDLGSFLIAVAGSFVLLLIWEQIEARRQKRDEQTPAAPN
jgi:uncharacterized membrane protein YeaQ/YmgE (transglycosylase-associated protein family)